MRYGSKFIDSHVVFTWVGSMASSLLISGLYLIRCLNYYYLEKSHWYHVSLPLVLPQNCLGYSCLVCFFMRFKVSPTKFYLDCLILAHSCWITVLLFCSFHYFFLFVFQFDNCCPVFKFTNSFFSYATSIYGPIKNMFHRIFISSISIWILLIVLISLLKFPTYSCMLPTFSSTAFNILITLYFLSDSCMEFIYQFVKN